MDLNGWFIRGNTFTKSFIDYVVEVKEVQPVHMDEDIRVTIWKGNGYERTKHSEYFPNFEQAFRFVDEFYKQKLSDKAIENTFNLVLSFNG